MRSDDDIAGLYADRIKLYAADHAKMADFEAYIRDEKPVAMTEMDRSEQSAIANLAAQGLSQMAARAGSVLPMPEWPAERPGFKNSEDAARTRKKASLGWWEQNDMQAVLTLRSEHLLGHSIGPVSVLPNPLTGIPTWRVREPLHVLPAPCANPLDVVPADCLIAYTQSWWWLKRTFGDRVFDLCRPKDCKPDQQFTFLEYVDHEQITTLAGSMTNAAYGTVGTQKWVRLDRMVNKAERPLVFVPTMWGIGGRQAKFAGTQGTHQMRAKLLALAYITASKGASPDTYLEPFTADQQSDPEILQVFNPRSGEPGIVSGGKLRDIPVNPSSASLQMLSILERELRLAGGIPAAFGGEAPTTVQTARLGQDLVSNAVDFELGKVQQKFERSLEAETKAAVAIVKKWTSGRRSFYVSWKGAKGQVDYDPAADFSTDNVTVRYPLIGSDLNNSMIRVQSKVATKMWSRQTGREEDPETRDAELEHDRVIVEAIEDSVLAEFLQPGSMDVTDKAKVMAYVASDKMELAAAIAKVHAEAQAAQAAAAQAAAPAEEMQSGINPLAPAVAGGAPPIPQGPPALSNLVNTIRNVGVQAPQAA